MDVIDVRNPGLVSHKGFLLIKGLHDPDAVDMIRNLEIKESDVLVVTYPKSGTIWMQQILLLLEAKGDLTAISKHVKFSNAELVPWIEVKTEKFIKAPSPRMTVSHLPFSLLPSALSQKKGKVIYVARNPKDVLVSYFHFHKVGNMLETPTDFDDFFEKFMRGDVFASSWFEHIKAWYLHKDDINMLFLTYEEMVKDLHSAVERIALFLGSALTDEQLADVVKHATFNNMKKNPQANYERVPGRLLSHHQGTFLRKGTIGDWKNHFTVAQNERFDDTFHREMADIPLDFIWDIKDVA
uniref:Sulfotransferase n=1 Tax=Gasterosteus aculeatus aculeatus TaxID=481459 RepID=G3N456_GASAC|nr:amine sulfotransferase-like isoform X2 [Gasterosteus aculeatus aculeatus]